MIQIRGQTWDFPYLKRYRADLNLEKLLNLLANNNLKINFINLLLFWA